jgi:hypothetical protein
MLQASLFREKNIKRLQGMNALAHKWKRVSGGKLLEWKEME